MVNRRVHGCKRQLCLPLRRSIQIALGAVVILMFPLQTAIAIFRPQTPTKPLSN